MAGDATRYRRVPTVVPWLAIGVVLIGVFSTWTRAGPVTLNGIEGPNDGWLVAIVAVVACAWVPMLERRASIGVLGVLGSGTVICWTAIESWVDNRRVLDASVGHGLLLVVAGGVLLAAAAAVRGLELVRTRSKPS